MNLYLVCPRILEPKPSDSGFGSKEKERRSGCGAFAKGGSTAERVRSD